MARSGPFASVDFVLGEVTGLVAGAFATCLGAFGWGLEGIAAVPDLTVSADAEDAKPAAIAAAKRRVRAEL